jgi:tetratricopeptide (TPR) repeat protein
MKSRKRKSNREFSRAGAESEFFLATLMADVRDGALSVATQKIDARRDIVDAHPFASYLAGLIRISKGEEEKAIEHFGRAVALAPDHAQALYGRAVALQKCGRAQDALPDYEASLRLDPGNAEGWFNYGSALLSLQRHLDAWEACTKVVALAPDHAAALANRGLALHALGRDDEALADYDRVLALGAADKVLLRNRAVSLARLSRHEEALASFTQAFAQDESYLEAADGAACALMALRRFGEAGALCDHVLAKAPDHAPALLTKGNALHELKRFDEALAVFEAALARANDVRLLTNRGMSLFELGRFEEAHASAIAAIAADPGFALAWRCRGMVEMRNAALDEALASFDTALRLSPDDADVLCGRAIVLKELGRYQEALAEFDHAIALDPRNAEAKANKGSLLLLLERFEEGWELFEHRWVQDDRPKAEVSYRWPEWRGEPIAGKSIVMLDEAGLGDALQFCRYAPLLAERGARVTYRCRPSLERVMRGLGPDVEITAAAPADAAYDYCVTLCSLPRAFATRAETIPGAPYLRAEAERVALWRERLRGEGFKVGIAWHGSSHSRSDHMRAAPLDAFAPLARVPGVRLFSLQKNFGAEQLRDAPAGMRVESLGEDFDAGPDAFVDTAAVIENLDLVVTIDTSIAHLAGALGRPVWIAIKHSPEWRWMLERETSPWYDSARLFRQSQRGDWDEVFERMARELERVAHERSPEAEPVMTPCSVGDLVDRLTILEIKSEKMSDPSKLANVARELSLLRRQRDERGFVGGALDTLTRELKETNLALWDIEDRIRNCEKREDFGTEFIALARSVYQRNDHRALLKRRINDACGSAIVEEKSYDEAALV